MSRRVTFSSPLVEPDSAGPGALAATVIGSAIFAAGVVWACFYGARIVSVAIPARRPREKSERTTQVNHQHG